MAEITASAVKSLRDRTGAGMMDCKKALQEAGGDEEKAIDLLRQRGAAKAAKRADKAAEEGAIRIAAADDGRNAAMVEVVTETDFVSRNEDFVAFTGGTAEEVLRADAPDGERLSAEDLFALSEGETLRNQLNELRARVGENVRISRGIRYETADGVLGTYVHFGNQIGVVVELGGEGASEELARDVAMHIAAADPAAVRPEDLPEETVARERKVLEEQAKGEGKPEHIVEKIVEGRLRKFYEQNTLLEQAFVKDPDRRIRDLLSEAGEAEVRRFVRFEIGT